MNLEGTKHEKAVLVVIAYIIGFTSGFIAFGISSLYQRDVATVETPEMNTEQLPPTDLVLPTSNPPEIVTEPEVVSYEDGKLYATVGAERFVLSLHSEIMPTDNVEGFSTQGIHESLPAYSAAADGRFVHFCEQQTATLECTHFVFDTENSVIHPVSFEGTRFITSNEIAKTATFTGDTLSIGEYYSSDMSTPWKLVK